jgi:hypothetical protein
LISDHCFRAEKHDFAVRYMALNNKFELALPVPV